MSSSLDFWMNEVNRINNAKHDIANAIRSKGVDLSSSIKIDGYPDYINTIKQYDKNYSVQAYNGNNMVSYTYSLIGDFRKACFGFGFGNITNIYVGKNITNLSEAFYGCNITCDFVCPENIIDISRCFMYSNCSGNHYYNNCLNIRNVSNSYYGKTGNRLNIFTIPENQNIFLNSSIGSTYWEEIMYETIPENYNYCYYNTYSNIYVYTKDYWESSGMGDGEEPDGF